MKKVLLLWLFLIIYCALVSISNGESSSNPETRDAQVPGHDDKLLPDGDGYGEGNKGMDQLRNLGNVKRAKGTYGGGDVLRPRNTHSAASPNLVKASVLSMALKHIAPGLLAISIFY